MTSDYQTNLIFSPPTPQPHTVTFWAVYLDFYQLLKAQRILFFTRHSNMLLRLMTLYKVIN